MPDGAERFERDGYRTCLPVPGGREQQERQHLAEVAVNVFWHLRRQLADAADAVGREVTVVFRRGSKMNELPSFLSRVERRRTDAPVYPGA